MGVIGIRATAVKLQKCYDILIFGYLKKKKNCNVMTKISNCEGKEVVKLQINTHNMEVKLLFQEK